MRKLLLAAFLFGSLAARAAGTATATINQVGASPYYVLTYSWIGDASTGTVPLTQVTGACSPPVLVCTAAQMPFGAILPGLNVLMVETVPSSPAPTNGYSVALQDLAGTDVLAGAAATVSSTASQVWSPAANAPPLTVAGLKLAIGGQHVASAAGSVYVFLGPVGPGAILTAQHSGGGGGGGSTVGTAIQKANGSGGLIAALQADAAALWLGTGCGTGTNVPQINGNCTPPGAGTSGSAMQKANGAGGLTAAFEADAAALWIGTGCGTATNVPQLNGNCTPSGASTVGSAIQKASFGGLAPALEADAAALWIGTGCGTATNVPQLNGNCAAPGTAASALTDCQLVKTSATQLTLAACQIGNNGITTAVASQTFTVSGSTGLTAGFYVTDSADGNTSGTVIVNNSIATGLGCSACGAVVLSTSSFPVSGGVVLLGTWTATGTPGNWDTSGFTNLRAFPSAGARLRSTNGNCSVAYDSSGAALTCSAGSSLAAATYWVPTGGYSGINLVASTNATLCGAYISPPGGLSVGHIWVNLSTADGSHLSDFGIYNATGTLLAHTGALNFSSSGSVSTAFSGGTQSIPAGLVWICLTSNNNVIAANGFVNSESLYAFGNITSATTSGVLNSSITPPTVTPTASSNVLEVALLP